MKKIIPFVVLSAAVVVLVVMSGHTVSGQAPAPGRLTIFTDMALFSGHNQPRNCFTMNRFKAGEPVGFRVTVISWSNSGSSVSAIAMATAWDG